MMRHRSTPCAGNVHGVSSVLGRIGCYEEVVLVAALMALAFVVLIGPLAVLYGVDSRVDDRREGWPTTSR
jgi:hypothetical protein